MFDIFKRIVTDETVALLNSQNSMEDSNLGASDEPSDIIARKLDKQPFIRNHECE